MALKNCKECGKEVSSSANKCPNCGKDQRNWFMRHKILSIIGALIILMIIGAAMNPKTPNTTPTNNSNTPIVNKTNDNQITKETYDKIQNGMTKEQIKEMLGEPKSVSENEFQGVGKTELYHYQKGFSTTAIDVWFTNGKVSSKNWTQL